MLGEENPFYVVLSTHLAKFTYPHSCVYCQVMLSKQIFVQVQNLRIEEYNTVENFCQLYFLVELVSAIHKFFLL